jgi:hypothetical protein
MVSFESARVTATLTYRKGEVDIKTGGARLAEIMSRS